MGTRYCPVSSRLSENQQSRPKHQTIGTSSSPPLPRLSIPSGPLVLRIKPTELLWCPNVQVLNPDFPRLPGEPAPWNTQTTFTPPRSTQNYKCPESSQGSGSCLLHLFFSYPKHPSDCEITQQQWVSESSNHPLLAMCQVQSCLINQLLILSSRLVASSMAVARLPTSSSHLSRPKTRMTL